MEYCPGASSTNSAMTFPEGTLRMRHQWVTKVPMVISAPAALILSLHCRWSNPQSGSHLYTLARLRPDERR